MTTANQPAPEPHYVTAADLEAFEGRVVNRMSEMKLRLVRDTQGQFRWIIGLLLPLYALVIGAILAVALAATNILARLPR